MLKGLKKNVKHEKSGVEKTRYIPNMYFYRPKSIHEINTPKKHI